MNVNKQNTPICHEYMNLVKALFVIILMGTFNK